MIEVEPVALGLAVGATFAPAVSHLRKSTALGRGQIRDSYLGPQKRLERLARMREQRSSRMIHFAGFGESLLLTAFLDAECDIEQLLYSPDADEQRTSHHRAVARCHATAGHRPGVEASNGRAPE